MHKKLAFCHIFVPLGVKEVVNSGGRINNCQDVVKTFENETTEDGKDGI